MAISTRDLSLLPDVARLRAAMQSMALLDAIIEPDHWLRYFSFVANFSPDGSIWLGSMQNGSGDDLVAIFNRAGCLIRGFVHESPMSPFANDPPKVFPGILDGVPPEFADCFTALESGWWETVTFCVWRRYDEARWHHGDIHLPTDHSDPDGSEDLLSIYDGEPATYHRWAEDYYQPATFSLDDVVYIFEHRPLTEAVMLSLNAERFWEELLPEVELIGYPLKGARNAGCTRRGHDEMGGSAGPGVAGG